MSYASVDKNIEEDKSIEEDMIGKKAFERYNKRYTVIAEEAEYILPKCKAINEYDGNPERLIGKFR